jgi:hypothetical protein
MHGSEVASLELILMVFDVFSRPKLRVSHFRIQVRGRGMPLLYMYMSSSSAKPSSSALISLPPSDDQRVTLNWRRLTGDGPSVSELLLTAKAVSRVLRLSGVIHKCDV